MICQCFIHWSSLTHKERALEMPSCWCLFHITQTLSSSVTEYVPRNLCLSIPQPESPGLLEDAEVSCLYRKEWFVSGWWEEKVRTLALQDPLAKKHSLPRIFSRPPASTTAFLKKLEASRGRKIAWPQVGKSWQQRPGEDKGKKYRNRTQPVFQESLHQWRRKNSLVLLRGMNLFFSTYQKRHQSKCKNHS